MSQCLQGGATCARSQTYQETRAQNFRSACGLLQATTAGAAQGLPLAATEHSLQSREDQPERALRSRSTRTKTAAPQQDGSPENSSDEEPEPERHYERSARQARKASKLVQGGGGMSDDEDSASGEKARHCRRSNAETRRSRCLRSYPIAASYKRKICWTPNWA